jgi:hypothetical protein
MPAPRKGFTANLSRPRTVALLASELGIRPVPVRLTSRVHQRGPGLPTAASVVGRFTGPPPPAPRGAGVLESVRGAGPSFRGSRGAAQVNRLTSGARRGGRESFSRGGHLRWDVSTGRDRSLCPCSVFLTQPGSGMDTRGANCPCRVRRNTPLIPVLGQSPADRHARHAIC